MKSRLSFFLVMVVFMLAFWIKTDISKAYASETSNSIIIKSEDRTEELLTNRFENLITPNAELLKHWVVRVKFFAPYTSPNGAPKLAWHEEIINSTPMAGYLSLVGKTPGGPNYYQYEGYLYNKKYPIPQLRFVEEDK
ncbi:hypothetical protein SFC08_03970 [Lysinibacillus halotolerans]